MIVSSYTHYGNYEYTAPVTKSNPLYAIGTELGMTQPAYFFSVSPTLDASFTYTLEATDSADLAVNRKTMIVATAMGSADGQKKIYWQKKFPIQNVEAEQIQNGATLTHQFTLDIPDINSMVKQVQEQLQYTQDTTIEIITYVTYEGEINGKSVSGVKEFPMPLITSSSYYQLPEKLSSQETIDTYELQRIPVDPSFSSTAPPLILLLITFGLLVSLVIGKKRCTVIGQPHIKELEREREYEQFAEWISTGSLLSDIQQYQHIRINSLQDLVDVAIDTNSRVIKDTDNEMYFVINKAFYFYNDSFMENDHDANMNEDQ